MSRNSSLRIAALACAALMTGCGDPGGRRDQRAAALQGTSGERLTVTGCLQPGALETKFVLTNVHTGAPTDRQEVETITTGSLVQLRTDKEPDLHKYVGRQVSVTGTLVDSGASTIGTSGRRDTPRNWPSIANGTAPIVHVENVSPTGRGCMGGLAP